MLIKTGTGIDQEINILGSKTEGFYTKHIIACIEREGNSSFAADFLYSVAKNNPDNFTWIDTCCEHPCTVPVISLPPPVKPDKLLNKVFKPLLHVSKVVAFTDLRGVEGRNWQWLSKLRELIVDEDALLFIFTGKVWNKRRQDYQPIACQALKAYASMTLEEIDDGRVECTQSSIGNTFPPISIKQ